MRLVWQSINFAPSTPASVIVRSYSFLLFDGILPPE